MPTASADVVAAAVTEHQAESASISNGLVESNHAGYTGSGFVNYDNETGAYVEFTVTAATAGPATLSFRYANGTAFDNLQIPSDRTSYGSFNLLRELSDNRVKVMIDAYTQGKIGTIYIVYTRFINTMKQEPVMEQLLPLSGERLGAPESVWDYLYEPEARAVLDQVMTRYIEALIFQAVSENMASEQSARMVAMKAASDNAATLIDELTLVYNKNRQANITKELSEIVGGAAAV